jgi:hypothetical protein
MVDAVNANYRLTSNSPARKADAIGGDLGAFPYTGDATMGLQGTLFVDTTLSGNNTALGDLTVAPGVTLTLAAGTTLTFPDTADSMGAGADTSRSEFIINGKLLSNGTLASGVTITGAGATSTWTGLKLGPASSGTTLSYTTISRAATGLSAPAGSTATLAHSAFVNDSTGVESSGGSVTITSTLFQGDYYTVASASGSGGTITVDHCTFYNNTYGVYASSGSTSITVSNSVLYKHSTAFYRYSSGSASVTTSYNDVWNSSTDYSGVTHPASSFSSNPLMVDAVNANYRLTSNSPARKADATGRDLGAFPYVSDQTVGLQGTLFVDTSLSGPNSVLGDLTVAPGVTLTLAAGTTLTFPDTADTMGAGVDTSRTELIINGKLLANGTTASGVTLTGAGATSTWTGVAVGTTGTATLTGTRIEKAATAITSAGATTLTSDVIANDSTGVTATAGTLAVSFTVFSGDYYTVASSSGSATITVDHCTFYNDTYGVYASSGGTSISVTSSILQKLSTAFYRYSSGSASVTASYNDVSGNSTDYSGVTAGTGSLTSVPLMVDPANGDYHLQGGSPCIGTGKNASDMGAFPYSSNVVDHLVLSPSTGTVTAGGQVGFSATAYDAANNTIPGVTITWSATSSAGTITQGGLLTAACTAGTFANAVTATAPNGKTASAGVTISTGPVASLTVSPATATVAGLGTQTFSVTAKDACNNTVSTPSVTWSVSGSPGSVSQSGVFTGGCTPGTYTNSVVATASTVTASASVTVTTGPLATLAVSPSSASVPVNGTQTFSATAADACGTALTPNITWSTNVAGASVSSSGVFTAGSTVTSAPGTVTATSGSKSGTAQVTVTAGSITRVVVTPANASLAVGATQQFTAQAYDAANNPVAGAATWAVINGGGTLNAGGLFTAGTVAGTYAATVQATISGVTATAGVVVQPGPIDHVTVSPATATLAPSGTTTFTATAVDAAGNTVPSTLTWSVTSAAGTITQGGVFTAAAQAGSYPNAVTATAGSSSGHASVTISAGALSQLVIAPSVTNVQAGSTVAFTVSGRDAAGNAVTLTPTWSVVQGGGTISATGIFTAGSAAGTFANTVKAEASGLTAFATVVVTPGPAISLEVTPTSTQLLPGTMQQFSASAKDAFNNPVAVAVTWTANASAGAVTQGGLFTAGSQAGDYPDGVTAAAGVLSVRAAVRVLSTTDGGVTDAGVMDAGVDDAGMGGGAGGGSGGGGGSVDDAGTGGGTGGGSSVGGENRGSGCTCQSVDALTPLFGLLGLALRRRRARR